MLSQENAWMQKIEQVWVPLLLIASFLAVPISTTAKSIFLAMAMVLIVTTPAYRPSLKNVLSQFWSRASILMFMLVVAACFWSPASIKEKLLILEKFSKLLYLPILVVGFYSDRLRRLALQVFLIAMAVTCLVSLGKYSGLIEFNGIDPGRVFRNHIMTGYMMAFAAYLSALLFNKARGKLKIAYALGFLIFSYQVLFVNTGRTGYVIYILLMMLLALQILSWKQIVLALVLGSSGLMLIYNQNVDIHTRVDQIYDDWQQYQHENKDTSVGYRLQFHQYAKELFQEHPWFGNGTSSFTYSFAHDKPVPSWDRRLLEPHSLYWLVAAEFGIAGLLALSLFFGSLFIAACRLQTMRPIAMAVLIPFFIGNLSDSLLFYSGTGYFFILFMALCFSELVPLREQSLDSAIQNIALQQKA